MKTIEIVVDEMPESCAACPYSADKYVIRCMVLDQPGKNYCTLPDCPLVAWQSSEDAPKDGNEFLLAYPGREAICATWFADETYPIGQDRWEIIDKPGWRWRPMPKTPEVKE